jgi:hypothetical protein
LFVCGWINPDNINAGLDALNHLLWIGTSGYEMDVVFVFVDVIAKDLLTLFIDHVQVVHDDQFLFTKDGAVRLTKCLHFCAIITDALFLQIVDEKEIVFGESLGFR